MWAEPISENPDLRMNHHHSGAIRWLSMKEVFILPKIEWRVL